MQNPSNIRPLHLEPYTFKKYTLHSLHSQSVLLFGGKLLESGGVRKNELRNTTLLGRGTAQGWPGFGRCEQGVSSGAELPASHPAPLSAFYTL